MATKPRYRVSARRSPVVVGDQPSAAVSSFTPPYEGAGHGRRSAGWNASSAGPNAALLGSRSTLVRRSRDLVRTDGYAKAAIREHVQEGVGTGIRPQIPDPDLQSLWDRWQRRDADPTRKQSFYGLQATALWSMLEGGDAFGRLRYRRMTDNLSVPLQIQIMETEQIPHDLNGDWVASGNNTVIGGIEYNWLGQPQAVHAYRSHPGDGAMYSIAGPNIGTVRIPIDQMLHLHDVGRPGEVRGEPILAQAIARLKDLHDYEAAELVRKLYAAYQVRQIQTPQEDPDGDALEGLDDSDDADVQATTADEEADEDTVIEEMRPGQTNVLPPGYKSEITSPADSANNYEPHLKRELMAVAKSAGVPYGSLSGDWSDLNDRSIRAVIQQFRRRLERIQRAVLIDQLCQPVFEAFVDQAVLSGAWTPPEGWTVEGIKEAVRWIPQGWPHIHPVQDREANRLARRIGEKSRKQIVREGGGDPDEVLREIAEENEQADQLGLPFDDDPRWMRANGALHSEAPIGDEDDTSQGNGSDGGNASSSGGGE